MTTDLWPEELRLAADRTTLKLSFNDGTRADLSAELLRVESPSAEVKGHGPGQETLVTGKRQVLISAIEPVGNYAVRLTFSDGHSTGIYTWPYLAKLGREREAVWAGYLQKLEAAGQTRG
jgi:DUF971 family protein